MPQVIFHPMTDRQQREEAKRFSEDWKGRGSEKSDSQPFWLALLRRVFGIENPEDYIKFEDRVHLDHTSFIDATIEKTQVLIEQKSINKSLTEPCLQSDGSLLTPFEQAMRYVDALLHEKGRQAIPRWIVTCNFQEFQIFDMDNRQKEPVIVLLKNLSKDYEQLNFLIEKTFTPAQKEMLVSKQAGQLIKDLYNAFLKQYRDQTDPESLKSLNALCVRLVFCFYAEDAGAFGKRTMFHDYLQHNKGSDCGRQALLNLFAVLNTPVEQREYYMEKELASFPYVNGDLFSAKHNVIPYLTEETYDIILNKASASFDWSEISPTIFGALFESTLNPDTRRKGGMHYTSIENIHKVIDPLFLDDLREELESCKRAPIAGGSRTKRLTAFQDKLSKLTFLDPAAGSGNFLTETYICLRRMENEIIKLLQKDQIIFGEAINPIKVSISQFIMFP